MIKIFIIALLPLAAFCQQKNDNVILVKNITFDKIVNALLDSGYKIDKMDKEFFTVKTEFKNICGNCIPQISINIRIKDSVATITGMWRTNAGIRITTDHPEFGEMKGAYIYPIKNESMKAARLCFEKMDEFSKSFGTPVFYLNKQ